MANVLGNLKILKQDMENKRWVVDSFHFQYKKQDYIVIAKLYGEDEARTTYGLIKLEFLKENDFKDNLLVEANSGGLLIDAKTLCKYFCIAFSDNLGSVLKQFNEHLSTFIPIKVIEIKPVTQKEALVFSLSKSDAEDPRKTYCNKIRRNPPKRDGSLGRRSIFNDNKTRLLRPILYQKVSVDTNLSFCFSMNPLDENTDEIIISNWAKNKSV